MNGWMIAVDGSAVNLARVNRVVAGLSAASDSEGGKRWYVAAEFVGDNRWMSGAILASKIESREAAVNWIRQHFGPEETEQDRDLKAAAEFYGVPEEYLRSLPRHEAHCALVTTHHLTCTCGAYARQHRSVADGSAT